MSYRKVSQSLAKSQSLKMWQSLHESAKFERDRTALNLHIAAVIILTAGMHIVSHGDHQGQPHQHNATKMHDEWRSTRTLKYT